VLSSEGNNDVVESHGGEEGWLGQHGVENTAIGKDLTVR